LDQINSSRFEIFRIKGKRHSFLVGWTHTSFPLGPSPAIDAVQTKPAPSASCSAAAPPLLCSEPHPPRPVCSASWSSLLEPLRGRRAVQAPPVFFQFCSRPGRARLLFPFTSPSTLELRISLYEAIRRAPFFPTGR
jgi:hypothetical protein